MPAMTRPMQRRGRGGSDMKHELGDYIRQLRLDRGLTQAELAQLVGVDYYTSVSAIETGRNTLPPERYHKYAEALGVNPKTFMRRVLQLTNPWSYAMLYDADPYKACEALNETLGDRMGTSMNTKGD